ncbi:MAG TPA: O-antigen ligase family protein [Roseiarcus sp.]|nr:O-antigen ligase family protein [Roseiarcus sp.]
MRTSEPLKRGVLWTYLAVSGFVAIEPSPFEYMFPIALLVFADGGMLFDRALAPLVVTLLIWSSSGFLTLIPWVQERESVDFVFITLYICLATITFAAIVARDPLSRMATIRSGYVAAGVISAMLGIIGYFNIADTGQYFTIYGNSRAMGFFKDPNVFAPFLVPPIIWLLQDLFLQRGRKIIILPSLVIMIVGVLLSFSRGAIIDCVFSVALLLGITFLTAQSSRLRTRAVVVAALVGVLVAVIVAIVLAIPVVRQLALERATLSEDYDSGPQGRFGNQVRSIPMLLVRPFGFGPLRFGHIFPQDPHEVFLSAFASFGWSGGLAFLTFAAVTVYLGWRLCFRRSPVQAESIGLWAALFPQILQGVQIDTSHWRHLFVLCGCLYGLVAAERRFSASRASGAVSIANRGAEFAGAAPRR